MSSLPTNPYQISNGSLHQQLVRCGKPTCRCTRGAPHIAHYFLARVGGRQVKRHVRKADVHAFSRLVAAATLLRKHRREELKRSKESLKAIRQVLRKTKINK